MEEVRPGEAWAPWVAEELAPWGVEESAPLGVEESAPEEEGVLEVVEVEVGVSGGLVGAFWVLGETVEVGGLFSVGQVIRVG